MRKENLKHVTFGFILSLLTFSNGSWAAPNDTPDFWKCTNRSVKNAYQFGNAAYTCDVDHFLDVNYVEKEFSTFIFDQETDVNQERRRYMSQVHALIRETARYYMLQRKPNVSDEEMSWWLHSAFTIGNQESFWSHYRYGKNNKMQYMRGDYGHGHGIFQVDDRWHYTAVTDGRAANIVMNMVYSLEEYYAAWQKAPSTSCVSSPEDYRSRTRAAYSAYNGGLRRICRWTNPNDRWARNDVGYITKFDSKQWENYIDDFDIPSPVDIECIVEGREGCANVGDPVDPTPKLGRLYKSSDNRYCVYTEEENDKFFNCVDLQKDSTCLVNYYEDNFQGFNGSIQKMASDFEEDYQLFSLERHLICENGTKNFVGIGKSVKLHKNINLRATPGGTLFVTIPRNNVVQVLDYEFNGFLNEDRYYKVKYKNHIGYFYGGSRSSHLEWATKSEEKPRKILIARHEDSVKVTSDVALSVKTAEGEIIGSLEQGDIVEVQETFVAGDNNNIHYKFAFENIDGYVFAGHTAPKLDIEDFFEVVQDDVKEPEEIFGRFKKYVWWRSIRSCASKYCDRRGTIRGPRLSKRTFKVVDEENGYYKIQQGSKVGWVKKKYVILL